MTVILDMSVVTPSQAITNRPGARPQRSPPRNADGVMTCTHDDCKSDQPTFKRLCEYNKHMDKHERPYKCANPQCKKNPGFTYAGGLLRHQREVHSMHRTKDPFFCPFASCNRSSGTGFSRRENMEEHLRRRHSGFNGDTAESVVNESPGVSRLEPLPPSRKRRAGTDADADDDDRGLGGSEADVRAQIMALQDENRRLKEDIAHRDQLLAEVRQENVRLRTPVPPLGMFRAPPPS